MSVGSDPDLARVGDAESSREWLRSLPRDDGERLGAIGALFARLSEAAGGHPRIGGDALHEVLEIVRIEQCATIAQRLKPLAGRPVPYTPIEWPLLHSSLVSLRASRNLYKRAYAQMLRGEGGETLSSIPGASHTLRSVMPLIRALDAQSRIVSLLLQHRCVPQAADWDELCVLARNVRRTSFQDETLSDEAPLVKPTTARALFVYPLLLECASLATRSLAEANFTQRLAARLASRIGYRIDHGAPRDNEHGPRLALTGDYAVRLDAHRVPDALERRRRQWFAEGEIRATVPALPLPEAALRRLLDDLQRRWTENGKPRSAGSHPAAAAAAHAVRLRFGLPRMHSADVRMKVGTGSSTARGPAAGAPLADSGPGERADARYDYGRWEQNTIIRLALGTVPDRVDPTALLLAEGEAATRLADRPDGRTVIARQAAIPRAVPGALVAIAGEGEAAAVGSAVVAASGGTSALALGSVEAIEQLVDCEALSSRAHWLIVRLWAGVAVPVGVRVGDSAFFEDAWLLRGGGASCELACLVMAPGRAHGGDPGLLREPGGDVAIRFVTVLDRGTGYERLSIRTESARPPR